MFTIYAIAPHGSPEEFGCENIHAVCKRCRELEVKGYAIKGVIAVSTATEMAISDGLRRSVPEVSSKSKRRRMKGEDGRFGLRWDFLNVEHSGTWQWQRYEQDGTMAMQCAGDCRTLAECMTHAQRFGYAPVRPNKPRREGGQASHINLSDPAEIRYWCRELQCSQEQLLDAIRAEGSIVESVRVYLRAIR